MPVLALMKFFTALQGRLLRVRISYETPLDISRSYQFSWDTQKHFEDAQRCKVGVLTKQRKTVWDHVQKVLQHLPHRNGCLVLGDFSTPLQLRKQISPLSRNLSNTQDAALSTHCRDQGRLCARSCRPRLTPSMAPRLVSFSVGARSLIGCWRERGPSLLFLLQPVGADISPFNATFLDLEPHAFQPNTNKAALFIA